MSDDEYLDAEDSDKEDQDEEEGQEAPEDENVLDDAHQYNLRDKKQLKEPVKMKDYVRQAFISTNLEPNSYERAINCEDREKWIAAMKEGMDCLKRSDTWTLVNPPREANVLENK